MQKKLFFILFLAAGMVMTAPAGFESDVFKTAGSDLRITFIGHASLLFSFGKLTIYIDPNGQLADFGVLPKADLIFITHQHADHFDGTAIEKLSKTNTQIFLTAPYQENPPTIRILKNGDRIMTHGIGITVVPAYNIVHKRPNGVPYHPRGEGNGYVLDFAGCRVYVAGDTENIPEMAELKNIDIAFLPMNIPYTMTPEMAAMAAKTIKPRVLYPYHYSGTDPLRLVELLKDQAGMEVRIRKLQ